MSVRKKMIDLNLEPIKIKDPHNGDLYEEVRGANLYIREDVYELAKYLNINGAMELYSLILCSPTSITIQLGWTYTEVENSRVKLKNSIKDHVNKEFFNTPLKRETNRIFGALDPDRLDDD